ncbi:LOW QUALITY PROTEIN: villin-1-like [Pollicipes pollicipes]|uniref:LOW QUALITY PROTEIN: villin-1-like n=1 Tax=Pollicipes pollicipes TaxID=41117 RepID=UPI00188511F0|nr:LOW QUALITY PROTEIN: villin-1-like [Pollicipes pollicipes]
MASTDPAFRSIPKRTACFLIWRVENMVLVPLPRDQYGKFHRGDSYVVLSVSEPGQAGGVETRAHEISGPLATSIHFWLGSQTSQDEAGVAAYKTVELDDLLGGAAVQYREVEGHESQRFRAYFPAGIRHLDGGVASGLTHVTDDFEPTLYLVKGKRNPVIRQMPAVAWEHFNEGDVLVLDAKQAIYVWTGREANPMEKIQGAKLAQSLKDDHGGADIIIMESGKEEALSANEKALFNELLPLRERSVRGATEGSDDKQTRRLAEELRLYRCSDEDGALKVVEMKGGPLLQSDLEKNDSFIVDNGEQGIWVWVGRRATHKERAEAMRNAQGFIKKKSYSNSTPVTRVIDGGESDEFKSLFKSWRDKDATIGMGKKTSFNKIAPTIQTSFDASTLHEHRELAAQTQMVDDGSGKKEIWRVEDFDLKPLAVKDYGKFYAGDCYVVLYTYEACGRDSQLIYYWLGAHSSQDEQGTAALKTVEMDDSLGGRPVQVRVVQGKEPPHFLAMFSGHMVVYSGGRSSAFDGVNGTRDATIGDTYLLQVHGTTQYNTRAVQVECRAGSLNSNDCFVLRHGAQVVVWCGRGATGDEREMAKKLAGEIQAEPSVVCEGQERPEFWTLLGGLEPYANDKRLAEPEQPQPARLFQCSNASGGFRVEEVCDFGQVDLNASDVMLLDAWNTVFLWIGAASNKTERELSEKTAIEYLRTDPAGRGVDTPIVRVKQGCEPPNFTGFFGVWDDQLWERQPDWESVRKSASADNKGISTVSMRSATAAVQLPTYDLQTLREKDADLLPTDVDPSIKERYLTPEQFQETFGMTLEAFSELPAWKQQQLKKKVDLF